MGVDGQVRGEVWAQVKGGGGIQVRGEVWAQVKGRGGWTGEGYSDYLSPALPL